MNLLANERLVTVEARCANCRIPTFEPVTASRNYSVMIPKYIADGGSGYWMLNETDVTRFGYEYFDYECLEDYVKAMSPITSGLEDRITILV